MLAIFTKHKQFIFFLIVGGVGFLSDLSVFHLVRILLFDDLIIGRSISIFCAVLVTYFFHQHVTFKQNNSRFLYSFPRYIGSCAIMQGINFLIYTILILFFSVFASHPSLALAVGSVSVLALTFILSKIWIFNEK